MPGTEYIETLLDQAHVGKRGKERPAQEKGHGSGAMAKRSLLLVFFHPWPRSTAFRGDAPGQIPGHPPRG
jgi:hypothetical protein